MALEFCTHEDVVFGDAPLIAVLTQVKFPPMLSLLTLSGVAGFQAGIHHEYPTMLPPVLEASVQGGPQGISARSAPPVWRFTDDSKQWVVGLANDFISLETPHYTEIEDFLDRFQRILEVVRQVLRPRESLRIGLRKINMFQVSGHDTTPLSTIIRPELLSVLSVEHFPAPLTGVATQIGFQDEDNALIVRTALADPEGQEITKFVMDLDYFTERPYQIGGDRALAELLKYFSDGITSFFHWALLDSYKTTLSPRVRQKVLPK